MRDRLATSYQGQAGPGEQQTQRQCSTHPAWHGLKFALTDRFARDEVSVHLMVSSWLQAGKDVAIHCEHVYVYVHFCTVNAPGLVKGNR